MSTLYQSYFEGPTNVGTIKFHAKIQTKNSVLFFFTIRKYLYLICLGLRFRHGTRRRKLPCFKARSVICALVLTSKHWDSSAHAKKELFINVYFRHLKMSKCYNFLMDKPWRRPQKTLTINNWLIHWKD